ncbi:MAG TPA: helix-turn-helix domain-containing protein, partial [Flavobacterium sp.]|nr:helix-turn-helix domain-containing protein [Flavobacterium sp.]
TDGHSIDFSSYISKEEISKIAEAKIKLESPNALKPYFDYFKEQIAYDKIRIGLALIEKENTSNTKAYSVDEIRLQHSEAYKKWDVSEDLKLEKLFNEGKKPNEIALLLGRNQGAINSRLKKTGLK